MKELEKYSLSDLFNIKNHLKEELEKYSGLEDDELSYIHRSDRKSLTISMIETKYEIQDRIKIVIENIEKEYYIS